MTRHPSEMLAALIEQFAVILSPLGFRLVRAEDGRELFVTADWASAPVLARATFEPREALHNAGAEAMQEVKDVVGGGKMVASVKDADGNGIGLIQPGD